MSDMEYKEDITEEQKCDMGDSSEDSYIDMVDDEEEEFSWKKEIISWIRIFIVAFVAAIILDNYVIINANVPTGSMKNTIMEHDRMIGNRLAYIKSGPDRGDVVIFKFPDDPSQLFVKRVIGLPGEKVTIKDAKIYINDSEEPLNEEYLPEDWINLNDGLEYEVPNDSYFVMGDNRNHSNDARFWNNTFVQKDAILAEAVIVYWPFKDIKFINNYRYD